MMHLLRQHTGRSLRKIRREHGSFFPVGSCFIEVFWHSFIRVHQCLMVNNGLGHQQSSWPIKTYQVEPPGPTTCVISVWYVTIQNQSALWLDWVALPKACWLPVIQPASTARSAACCGPGAAICLPSLCVCVCLQEKEKYGMIMIWLMLPVCTLRHSQRCTFPFQIGLHRADWIFLLCIKDKIPLSPPPPPLASGPIPQWGSLDFLFLSSAPVHH